MNKNGKSKNVIVAVVIALVLIVGIYYFFMQPKTLAEHAKPADISQGESGTGLQLKFYDANGNPIEIPSWFSTASIYPMDFAIVSRPPAPNCADRTACTGYATNPNIMCWAGKCVLGNIAFMDAGVQVTNPSGSQLSFLNVAPTTATPTAFNTNLNKSVVPILAPGSTVSWGTTSPISVASFIGTNQTFSVTVVGKNEYTGQNVTVSDSLLLSFGSDPVGSLTVAVVSPI